MSKSLIAVFYTEDDDFDFEILLPGQGLNLNKTYSSCIFYTEKMLKLPEGFCLEYLELEKDINNFYFAHPYKMDKGEQIHIDRLEEDYKKMNELLQELIKKL